MSTPPSDAAERIRQASAILDACVMLAEAARRQLPDAPSSPPLLRGLAEDAESHRETQRTLWALLGPPQRAERSK